jgi:putative transposase
MLGLILAVVVQAADVQDRDRGRHVLECVGRRFHRLRRVWAHSGYAGAFVEWTRRHCGPIVEIVKRSDTHRFMVLPKRRIVERTFAWLGNYRRLSKNCETLPANSEMMICLAMINLMIHRLKPG